MQTDSKAKSKGPEPRPAGLAVKQLFDAPAAWHGEADPCLWVEFESGTAIPLDTMDNQRNNRDNPLSSRSRFAALSLFIILTLAATWPMARAPHRLMLGEAGDNIPFLSHLSWARQSIVEDHRLPFDFRGQFYAPFELSTLRSVHCTGYGLIVALGSLAYNNSVFWMNVCLAGSFILAGYGTFLLSRHLTGDTLGSLLAGAAYAFCASRQAYITHLNTLSSEFIPFFLLFAIRGLETRRPLQFAAAGFCMAATLWNGYYNTLFIGLFAILLWALNPRLRLYTSRPRGPLIRAALCGAVVFLVLSLPVLLGIAKALSNSVTPSLPTDRALFAKPLSYLIPTNLHTVLGKWLAPLNEAYYSGHMMNSLFVGFGALGLAIYGLARGAVRTPWQNFFAAAALVFFVLSLGSYYPIPLGGERILKLPLPYQVVQLLPVFGDFRVPGRFGFMTVMCVSILAAFGFRNLVSRGSWPAGKRRAAFAIALAWMIFEHAHFPHPFVDVRETEMIPKQLVRRIAEDPKPGVVMQLPMYPFDRRAGLLQAFHGKPLMNGDHVRAVTGDPALYYVALSVGGWFDPPFKAEEIVGDTLAPGPLLELMRLADAEDVVTTLKLWHEKAIKRFCYFFNIRYLLLPRMPTDMGLPNRLQKNLFGLEAEYEEDGAWLGIIKPIKGTFPILINSASPFHNFFFMTGFTAYNESKGGRGMVGESARLAFRLDAPRDLELTLHLRYEGWAEQQLTIMANDLEIHRQPINNGEYTIRFSLQEDVSRQGFNYLELRPQFHIPNPVNSMGTPIVEQAMIFQRLEIAPAAESGE